MAINSDSFNKSNSLYKSLSKINFAPTMDSNMNAINMQVKEMIRKEDLDRKSKESQIQSVQILEQIEKNTASLNDVVKLLHESNLQQAQIAELMGDLFAITKAKNKKEAKSLYEKTIGKISSLGEDVSNIASLVTLATSIYGMVAPLLH
ncbi:hypothetical protein [Pediococcus acidilactici]|uniref:hypothetical protein n=1 Tax=Pediococcus acidilactici TaxID=1254 RepID=UPI00159C5C26|nr:hypothetical protein [Pediococcus acidilactici]MDB8870364.1 hypothetical protein [Pediococcus acidilactici]MDB8878111.1 hypothetical protein [Pediococcus acidilactici]NVM32546.1 hypothetical protein [Pediococcus acidilactici]